VLALGTLAASIALAVRLNGGWPLIAVSALLGLGLYVAVWIAGRRVHVELGCLLTLLIVACILGGGHLLHALLLARGVEGGAASWATLFATLGPVVLLALLWGALDRTPSR
jgi:hypothetical protein